MKLLLTCTPVVTSTQPCPAGSLIIDKLANEKTAFHHALLLNKIEIAELLLKNGNAIDQPLDDDDGRYVVISYDGLKEDDFMGGLQNRTVEVMREI